MIWNLSFFSFIFISKIILQNNLNQFQATEESNVALAVRAHRTLELAGDNFYVITCGR